MITKTDSGRIASLTERPQQILNQNLSEPGSSTMGISCFLTVEV
jgi:hypothetical protein